MSKPDVVAARQVLCNELGLSRETVREIIREKVEEYIKSAGIEGVINRAVDKELDRLIKANRYDSHSIRTIVAQAAASKVATVIDRVLKAVIQ